MPKFRKRPIEIEAVQWFPGISHPGVQSDVERLRDPRWHEGEYGDVSLNPDFVITIHEQRAYLAPGDWIIPESKEGRYYPCKPDVFEKTYTPFNKHTQTVCGVDDLRALMDAMRLFPSVIRSGEQWTPTCATVHENALAALGRIRSSLTN